MASQTWGMGRTTPIIGRDTMEEKLRSSRIANDMAEQYGPGYETPAMHTARAGAEQNQYYDRLNSQMQPPDGFGASGKWGRWRSGGGHGEGGGDLNIPDYDQNRVESLAQRVAAPSVRKLRDQVQQVQGGVYDNPNVKSMTLRQALEGYGQGLENVMGGAFQTATGIYGQEYNPKVREAEINYQGDLQRELQSNQIEAQKEIARYNKTWDAWLRNNRA